MSDYPELKDYFEGFTDRYARMTDLGWELEVTEEELQKLSKFLVMGIVDWVEMSGESDKGDHSKLGECLENFANRYPHAGDVGLVVQVTEEEMIGLGLFLARGFVGWILRLDQSRGRFKGFDEVTERKRLSLSSPLPQRLMARLV